MCERWIRDCLAVAFIHRFSLGMFANASSILNPGLQHNDVVRVDVPESDFRKNVDLCCRVHSFQASLLLAVGVAGKDFGVFFASGA